MITSVLKNALAVYCFLLVTRGRRNKTSFFFIYLIFILILLYLIYIIMVYIDKANLETRVSGSAYVTTELGTLLKYTVRHRCDTTIVRENVFKNIHYHILPVYYAYLSRMSFIEMNTLHSYKYTSVCNGSLYKKIFLKVIIFNSVIDKQIAIPL